MSKQKQGINCFVEELLSLMKDYNIESITAINEKFIISTEDKGCMMFANIKGINKAYENYLDLGGKIL